MAAAEAPESFAPDIPAETKTLKALTLQSIKRTYDVFLSNYGQPTPFDESRWAGSRSCLRSFWSALGILLNPKDEFHDLLIQMRSWVNEFVERRGGLEGGRHLAGPGVMNRKHQEAQDVLSGDA